MENFLLCSRTLYDKDLLDKKKQIDILNKKNHHLKNQLDYLQNSALDTSYRYTQALQYEIYKLRKEVGLYYGLSVLLSGILIFSLSEK